MARPIPVGMVSVGGLVVVGVLVGLHTLAAAVGTRLLRVRLTTAWGPVVLALTLLPILLVASTLAVGGGLGIGPDLGSPAVALFVLVAVPLGLGMAIDYLWMPAPEDVELPETLDG